MKNCGQGNIPEVDNSSPCDEFIYSECVILNRKSDLIKGVNGMNGNEYLDALEGEIRRLKLEIKNIKNLVSSLIPDGIGNFEE